MATGDRERRTARDCPEPSQPTGKAHWHVSVIVATWRPSFEFAEARRIVSEQPLSLFVSMRSSRMLNHKIDHCVDRANLLMMMRIGSSGWTRTSNPPVNSRMLCH